MKQEKTIQVNGMTCGGCVNSVKNAITSLPGVEKADVSLEQKQAKVTFDDAKTNVNAIVAAVDDAGYEALAA